MGNVCSECGKPAVMDLVFGEEVEQVRVPWCAHCICPDTWDLHPFHHAQAYNSASPKYVKMGRCEEAPSKAFKVDENYSLQGNHYAHKFNIKGLEAEDRPCVPDYVPMVDIEDSKALYNRQPHYEGGIDPITYGKDNFTTEEMNGFYKMNVVKYVSRCDRKNGLEDLQKARDYLNLLIADYEKHPVPCEPVEDEDVIPVGKYSGKKSGSHLVKTHWETEDHELTEEEEAALKEARLCVDRFHAELGVEIKRADVLEIVQERLKDYSYEILSCGDGTTYIAKSPGEQ